MPSKRDILDLHFMDARCKLIDLAAFLDRLDRHEGEADFRLEAFRRALPILMSDEAGRARAVLEALSDPSVEPAEKATIQFAYGAPQSTGR